MQVHIIIYIRDPACARWYAYTGININIIENLKAKREKPFTALHLNLKDAFIQNPFYKEMLRFSIRYRNRLIFRQINASTTNESGCLLRPK